MVISSKGIIANFSEVFFPLSCREEAIQRYRASLRDKSGDNTATGSGGQGIDLPSEESRLKPKAM